VSRALRLAGFALLETALRLVLVGLLLAALSIRLVLGASVRYASVMPVVLVLLITPAAL